MNIIFYAWKDKSTIVKRKRTETTALCRWHNISLCKHRHRQHTRKLRRVRMMVKRSVRCTTTRAWTSKSKKGSNEVCSIIAFISTCMCFCSRITVMTVLKCLWAGFCFSLCCFFVFLLNKRLYVCVSSVRLGFVLVCRIIAFLLFIL